MVDRKLGGPQGHAGQLRNISAQLGFEPRTFRPLASCYTNYAIAAIIIIIIIIIIIVIIIIIISFMKGIYTYIPETNQVPRE
jgi:ABC-type multidrug transport system permease subunit